MVDSNTILKLRPIQKRVNFSCFQAHLLRPTHIQENVITKLYYLTYLVTFTDIMQWIGCNINSTWYQTINSKFMFIPVTFSIQYKFDYSWTYGCWKKSTGGGIKSKNKNKRNNYIDQHRNNNSSFLQIFLVTTINSCKSMTFCRKLFFIYSKFLFNVICYYLIVRYYWCCFIRNRL